MFFTRLRLVSASSPHTTERAMQAAAAEELLPAGQGEGGQQEMIIRGNKRLHVALLCLIHNAFAGAATAYLENALNRSSSTALGLPPSRYTSDLDLLPYEPLLPAAAAAEEERARVAPRLRQPMEPTVLSVADCMIAARRPARSTSRART